MGEHNNSVYQKLGGEKVLKFIVADFYHYMDTLSEAKTIRQMHDKNLKVAKERLFETVA